MDKSGDKKSEENGAIPSHHASQHHGKDHDHHENKDREDDKHKDHHEHHDHHHHHLHLKLPHLLHHKHHHTGGDGKSDHEDGENQNNWLEVFHHLVPPPPAKHQDEDHEGKHDHHGTFEAWSSLEDAKGTSIEEEDEGATACGIASCRPGWLQWFAGPWCFIAAYGFSIILQGMYFTYFLAVITTIENRFEIKSKTTGIVMAGNEVSEIMFALLLTYYGGKGHRPHWIACGILSISAASFVMASPYFFMKSVTPMDTTTFSPVQNGTTAQTTTPPRPGSMCLAMDPFNSTVPGVKPNPNCDFRNNSIRSLLLIFLSFFVSGLGISVIQPLGLSYYDDNVPPDKAPVFHGVLSVAKVLGPFMGFMLGSVCLRFYENPLSPPPGMKLNDPRWIGAWWLGFVVIAVGNVFPGFFIFLFPKRLPRKLPAVEIQEVVEEAQEEGVVKAGETAPKPEPTTVKPSTANTLDVPSHSPSHSPHMRRSATFAAPTERNPDDDMDRDFSQLFEHRESKMIIPIPALMFPEEKRSLYPLRDIIATVKRLVGNKLFMSHLVALNFQILANVGFFTFSAKYLESQFRVAAATSNLAVGLAGVLVMAFGLVIAGFLIKRFQPSPRFLTGYHALVTMIQILGVLGASTIGCAALNHFGAKDPSTHILNMTSACNVNCHCSPQSPTFVCAEPVGVLFYNPCYAGCTGKKTVEKFDAKGALTNQTVYTGCSCGLEAARHYPGEELHPDSARNETVLHSLDEAQLTEATQGYCPGTVCGNFMYYLVLLAVIKFIASTSRVGNIMITVRAIEKRDKSVAVGFSLVVFSLFGFIPAPILYGAIIDSTCLVWSLTECGNEGNCGLYDTETFRRYLHFTPACLLFISFLMDIVVWYYSSEIDLYTKESGVESPEEPATGNERKFAKRFLSVDPYLVRHARYEEDLRAAGQGVDEAEGSGGEHDGSGLRDRSRLKSIRSAPALTPEAIKKLENGSKR